jgi:Flp pilus assembly protein TadB
MDVTEVRTWVIFYLLSFVVLLVATFITSRGSQLWISLMLIIIVVGVNLFLLASELKRYQARRAFLERISKMVRDSESETEDGSVPPR